MSTRRPWLLLGAVAAGLLAMRALAPLVAPPAGVEATAPAPVTVAARPAVLAEATGAVLFLGGEDRLLRADLDERRVRPVSLPGGAAAGSPAACCWRWRARRRSPPAAPAGAAGERGRRRPRRRRPASSPTRCSTATSPTPSCSRSATSGTPTPPAT
ncbi:MAG TPA: hypothetical protein VF880_02365, partial [Actinomycetes bacterium]